MAEAGFVFKKEPDYVQCVSCKGIIHNWVTGDTAFGEHLQHFPSCLFVHKILADNEGGFTRLTPKTQMSIDVVRQMGCTDKKIRETLAQLLEDEENVDVDDLIDLLFVLKFGEVETPAASPQKEPVTDNETSASPQGKKPITDSYDSCILCFKNSVSSLFFLSRHLVVCCECVTDIQTCPKCQTYIAGTIRAYPC